METAAQARDALYAVGWPKMKKKENKTKKRGREKSR